MADCTRLVAAPLNAASRVASTCLACSLLLLASELHVCFGHLPALHSIVGVCNILKRCKRGGVVVTRMWHTCRFKRLGMVSGFWMKLGCWCPRELEGID